MQEELEQRTVSVTVQAAKLSGRVLKAAIAATLRKMEQERNTPKVGRNNMKRLAGRDGGANTIEVSGRVFVPLNAMPENIRSAITLKRKSALIPRNGRYISRQIRRTL